MQLARSLFIVMAVVFAGLFVTDALEGSLQAQTQKPDPSVIKLAPDALENVKGLKDAFNDIQQQRAVLDAKSAQVQALLLAAFNRACAKAKADPDTYEWTPELDGIRPKRTEPAKP